MAILAAASNAPVMVAGWLVAGAAMAACLYDPAFATLSQHTGERYRWSVTALTLWGGFASTVFWPLSQLLMDAFGWRTTFAIYAAMNGVACLPIHLWLVPRLPLGALLGHLSRAASYAKALAPAAWSALLAIGLARHSAIGVLFALGLAATASYWMAVRGNGPSPRPSRKADGALTRNDP